MKGLVAELMEQHWEQLQGVDCCDVFANMRIRHEQNQVGSHHPLLVRPPKIGRIWLAARPAWCAMANVATPQSIPAYHHRCFSFSQAGPSCARQGA